MALYVATQKVWISHQCRMVDEGEEFEATFPDGMVLSGNIKLVDKPAKAKKQEGKVDG